MSGTALDFRNTNSLWCSAVVETLARLGLRHAILCPGSRSTPLTFAFARHPDIEAIPVLDERSAAFFALGLARQHHRPTALLCTSGTAAASFLPAIIEAHESGVPLLVLTADRPPEMRECGSGQTIDQQKFYGGYVNYYHELAVPEAKLELLQYARESTAYAFERTQYPFAGPVHLNAPFRDPLPPVEDGSTGDLREKIDVETSFGHMEPGAGGAVRDTTIATPWKVAARRDRCGPAQPARSGGVLRRSGADSRRDWLAGPRQTDLIRSAITQLRIRCLSTSIPSAEIAGAVAVRNIDEALRAAELGIIPIADGDRGADDADFADLSRPHFPSGLVPQAERVVRSRPAQGSLPTSAPSGRGTGYSAMLKASVAP